MNPSQELTYFLKCLKNKNKLKVNQMKSGVGWGEPGLANFKNALENQNVRIDVNLRKVVSGDSRLLKNSYIFH